MCLENTSPKVKWSLAGLLSGSAVKTKQGNYNPDRNCIASTFPEKPFKNWCEHDKKAPKSYIPPIKHKKRPDINENGKDRLDAWYFKPSMYLKNICSLENLNWKERKDLSRQQKSQRREAIKCVGQVLLHYCDLLTLRIGWYDSTGCVFRPLSLQEIANKAQINIVRAKRALSDLMHSGYMKTIRRYDRNKQGDYIGLVSLRQLTAKFFTHLGFSYVTLQLKMHWKRKKTETQNPGILEKIKRFAARRNKMPIPEVEMTHVEKLMQGAQICKLLKEQNPHLSWAEIGMLASQQKLGP